MQKRLITGMLALTLAVSINTNVFADPASDRINEQQNIINRNKGLAKDAKENTDSIEGSIELLDEKINTLNAEIQANKTKMSEIQNKIKTAEKSIVEAENKMAEEQELYNKRLRAIYINNNIGINSYLYILMDSNGVSDFISRVDTVVKLAELDKKILEDLRQQQEDIKKKKADLEVENKNLAALVNTNNEKLATLNSEKQAQVVLVNQARAEERKYSSQVAAANAEIARIRAAAPKITSSRGDSTTAISSNAIVAYASNYIGSPYKYGSAGPSSFDCSGFTSFVFRHFGVGLNRVASDQARQGSPVSRDQLQPGDLVFFGKRGITHVGIYVGNNSYMHAPHTGSYVQTSPMSRSDFVCARRVY